MAVWYFTEATLFCLTWAFIGFNTKLPPGEEGSGSSGMCALSLVYSSLVFSALLSLLLDLMRLTARYRNVVLFKLVFVVLCILCHHEMVTGEWNLHLCMHIKVIILSSPARNVRVAEPPVLRN